MASAAQQELYDAAACGSTTRMAAALAAGADPNLPMSEPRYVRASGVTALHLACKRGHPACVRALLAAGANPNAGALPGCPHNEAYSDTVGPALNGAATAECAAALLAAGADPFAAQYGGDTAMHAAAFDGNVGVVRTVLEAAPRVALARGFAALLPLEVALRFGHWEVAHLLLERAPLLPPAGELLRMVEEARERDYPGRAVISLWYPHAAADDEDDTPPSLYAPLVARQPLAPAEWARVPTPCPGLGVALPAVLGRSEAEAALLVCHLPAGDRECLRTAALCMKRVERRRRLNLPGEVVRSVLAAAATQPLPSAAVERDAAGGSDEEEAEGQRQDEYEGWFDDDYEEEVEEAGDEDGQEQAQQQQAAAAAAAPAQQQQQQAQKQAQQQQAPQAQAAQQEEDEAARADDEHWEQARAVGSPTCSCRSALRSQRRAPGAL